MIDKELLEILACPACKAGVKLEGGKIVCAGCGRRYPIRDGIPIMLVDEAEAPGASCVPFTLVPAGESRSVTKKRRSWRYTRACLRAIALSPDR